MSQLGRITNLPIGPWLPGAMATYAENPQFVDPRQSVLAWCATWAVVCGAVGLVIGGTAGAFRAATPSSN